MVGPAQRLRQKSVCGWLVRGASLGLCACAVLYAAGLARPEARPQPGHALKTQAAAAAATTVAVRNPAGTLAILVAGQSFSIWEEAPTPPPKHILASDKAPPIDPDLLAGVEDKVPVRSAAENYEEVRAYNYALIQADDTPVAALAKGARRDLTFAHLFEEPAKYRGQIVHIEGRLGRLRRFDAPSLAVQQGIRFIYEGWIFGDAYFSNPYCVIATSVPESIPLGETLNHRVAFDGYFFKRYRYDAGDGRRDAPLLIGHALQDKQATALSSGADGAMTSMLLPGLVAVLGATILLVIGLHWWFRRADRRIRTHLDRTRNSGFNEPGPQSP